MVCWVHQVGHLVLFLEPKHQIVSWVARVVYQTPLFSIEIIAILGIQLIIMLIRLTTILCECEKTLRMVAMLKDSKND
jgi:hypothetical protein